MSVPGLKKLIDRYLNNNATGQEQRLVDEWYASYNSNDARLDAITEDALKQQMHEHIRGHVHQKVARVRRMQVMRFAAAILLLLGAAGVYIATSISNNNSPATYATIKTGRGKVKKLVLPDGTAVWLNAESAMRVADNFAGGKMRNVYLDEGEAFFEVKHDATRPFKVITPAITTQVLGTSFNVKAYHRLQTASVTVRTGKVHVTNGNHSLGLLTPGQQIIFDEKNRQASLINVNATNARSWLEGHTILTNASFAEVALALQNIYGVNLHSGNAAAAGYRYNVHINSARTLDETMQVICSVHQNQYRREKHDVIIY